MLKIDLSDLQGFYEQASQLSGRNLSPSLRRIELGQDAIETLPDILVEKGEPSRIVLVMDDTPMTRNTEDLKSYVSRLVEATQLPVITHVLTDKDGLHTTSEIIDELAGQLQAGDTVVSVGSGTITDISKHAIYRRQFGTDEPFRHVCIATANSVGAYTSELTPVSTNGVKRTLPSRLPDALILDTRLLAETPEEIAMGGIGDAAVGCCSLADYRLAYECGMGSFEPLAPAVFLPVLRSFLDQDDAFQTGGLATATAMAHNLVAAGFAMTFAGESAPASGLEHVTSHTLDMLAPSRGRPIGNHGEQCGLSTALVLIAFKILLAEFEPSKVDRDSLDVDPDSYQWLVESTFNKVDPTGVIGAECWSDVSLKVASWNDNLTHIHALLDDWLAARKRLEELAVDPGEYMAALAAAGHPLRFEDINPGLSCDEVRWAFYNARLMRKRLSIADFFGFLGLWNDDLVDRIFAEFAAIRDDVERKSGH